MELFIQRTNQLHKLDSLGFWIALLSLIPMLAFLTLELMNFLLPGNYFLVEGYSAITIHLLFALSTLAFVCGIMMCRSVNNNMKKLS